MTKIIQTLLGLAFIFMAASAKAEALVQPLVAMSHANFCYNFTPVAGLYGSTGYACSSYPQEVMVPDYYDLQNVLTINENRMAELEHRVAALEKKCAASH